MPQVRPSSRKRPGIASRAPKQTNELDDAIIARAFVPYGRGDLLEKRPNAGNTHVRGETTKLTNKKSPDSVLLANDLWVHAPATGLCATDKLAAKTPMRQEDVRKNQLELCQDSSKDEDVDVARETKTQTNSSDAASSRKPVSTVPQRRRRRRSSVAVPKELDYKPISEPLPSGIGAVTEGPDSNPEISKYKQELNEKTQTHAAERKAWEEKERSLQEQLDKYRTNDQEILARLKDLVADSPSIADPKATSDDKNESIFWLIERIAQRTRDSETQISGLTEKVAGQANAFRILERSNERTEEHNQELRNKLETVTANYNELQQTRQRTLEEYQESRTKAEVQEAELHFVQGVLQKRKDDLEQSGLEIQRLQRENAKVQLSLGNSRAEAKASKDQLRLFQLRRQTEQRRDEEDSDSDQTDSTDSTPLFLVRASSNTNSNKRRRSVATPDSPKRYPKRAKIASGARLTGGTRESSTLVLASSLGNNNTSSKSSKTKRRGNIDPNNTASGGRGNSNLSSLESLGAPAPQRKTRQSCRTALSQLRPKRTTRSSLSSSSSSSTRNAPKMRVTKVNGGGGGEIFSSFVPATNTRITREVALLSAPPERRSTRPRRASGMRSLGSTSESSSSSLFQV